MSIQNVNEIELSKYYHLLGLICKDMGELKKAKMNLD